MALLDRDWRYADLDVLTTGVLVIGSFALINALIELPLGVYSTFGIEARFGFNRTRMKTYVLDILKLLLLAIILGVPLLYAVLWLMGRSGQLWWLYVWILWLGFSLIITWAYPVLIAPLFNKFSPLGDENLKRRIDALLQRCGFTNRGVFVMDGSTRSAHGNAYFTGFGRHKRIVFFDTLMDKLAPEEIEAVLAHELGHFRLKHVIQRLMLTAVLSLVGLAILGWLAARTGSITVSAYRKRPPTWPYCCSRCWRRRSCCCWSLSAPPGRASMNSKRTPTPAARRMQSR